MCEGCTGYEWDCEPDQCELTEHHIGMHEVHGRLVKGEPWMLLWGRSNGDCLQN
jgi:hypothetical protein